MFQFKIAQKKFPSFVIVIVVFNSAEVLSNTNALTYPYSSHFKPLKGNKTSHHTEIVSNKIQENLLYPGWLCHSSSTNENEDHYDQFFDQLKFIKPECYKFYLVRYEFQCEKGGTTIKVLPAMCKNNDLEEHLSVFLKRVSNDQNILC